MICAESNHQRISFAGDLGQSDKAPPMEQQQQQQPPGPVRRDTTLLDSSNPDFEFHISRNFDPGDSAPADDIFADGMILPVLPFQVTNASAMPRRLYKYELPPIVSAPSLSSSSSSSLPPQPLPSLPQQHSRRYSDKETTTGRGRGNGGRASGANSDSEVEKSSKSFWSFKRSSSLNCDIKKSLICSFPRLTRSNSTGSVMDSKRAMLRDIKKHSSQRHGAPRPRENPSSHLSSSSSPSSVCCSSYQFRPQKHAGKNGGTGGGVGGGGGGSFRITPVIGGPSPFGLGSILRLSRDKKMKNK